MSLAPPSNSLFRHVCVIVVAVALLFAHTASIAAGEPLLRTQPVQLVFSADANQLSIQLPENQWTIELKQKPLLGSLSKIQQAFYDVPVFYEGIVTGHADSWARMMLSKNASSTSEQVMTGHVYIDDTLYQLRHLDDNRGYAIATLGSVELDPLRQPTVGSFKSFTGRTTLGENTSASRAIKIGIVVDSKYNESHNGRGLAHALGVINGVDGIYQSQLGLALVVETFRVYDDPATDPLFNNPGGVEQVLDTYREIRFNDAEMPADLALVHLFTGLEDPQKVIGLGWIDTACRVDGYDLSMSTPFTYDILLSAHEIAHNLGAVHDDDPNCQTDSSVTGTEIMWLELSGNTRPQFSACSIDRMRSALDASCVVDNIDLELQLTSVPIGGDENQRQMVVSVSNKDNSRIARQVQSSTRFPAAARLGNAPSGCVITANIMNCLHGNIAPSSHSTLSVNAAFNNAVVTSELWFDEFLDTQHLDNRASLQVTGSQIISSGPAGTPESIAAADASQSINDDSDSGGSAGLGNIGLLDLSLLAIIALSMRAFRPTQTQVYPRRSVTSLN